MAEEARVFFLRKRRERAEDTERRALLEGLGQTRPQPHCPGLCGL